MEWQNAVTYQLRPWDEFVLGSSGKILDIMEARIYKETPEAETGEIQVRGENVMVGYYKNQEQRRKYSRRTAGYVRVTSVPWTATEIFSSGDDSRLWS